MKKYNKKIIFIIITIILIIIGFFGVVLFKYFSIPKVDRVLKSDAYSYLPVEAKNFISDFYDKTGTILLTEKNKKIGQLYLNPEYVDYLTLDDDEIKIDTVVPDSTIEYFDYSSVDGDGSVLPSSFDLRNVNGKNFVSPVRNQGSFGLCWAFSSAESVETHVMLKNNTSYSNVSQQISERQIDYGLATNGLVGYSSPYRTIAARSLTTGGRFDTTTPLLASGASLWAYNDFKAYSDSDTAKMELSEVLRYDKSKYELMESDAIPITTIRYSDSLSETQKTNRTNYLNRVKSAIMENGSLYVGLRFNTNCMHRDSSSGLYVLDVYSCTSSSSDGHAMEIVGWDDNKEFSYCVTSGRHYTCSSNPTVTSKGAWIVRNSWGSTYSYIYLGYDSSITGLNAVKSVRTTSTRDWDNSYFLGEVNSAYRYAQITYPVNYTKIIGDEKLVRVKGYSTSSTANVGFSVTDKNGTVHSYSKTLTNAGLFYLDINDDVIIDNTSSITLSSDVSGSLFDAINLFTDNINTDPYIDLSPLKDTKVINYLATASAKRYLLNTKNISDGTLITFKLFDSNGNDISSKLVVGDKSNIVSSGLINSLLTFNISDKKGIYTLKLYNGNTLINSCDVFVNSLTGAGTEASPFLIYTALQFDEIRYGLRSYYKLCNDIDFNNFTNGNGDLNTASKICSGGYGFTSIDGFAGILDGNGNFIKNFRQNNYLICTVGGEKLIDINNTGNGIFSNLYGNATIKNLTITNTDINCSGGNCGLLASSYNESGSGNTLNINNVNAINITMNGNCNESDSNENLRRVVGGGLLGTINSENNNINLKNIYIGYDLTNSNIKNKGLLVSKIISNNIMINDIQLTGKVFGNNDDGILNYKMESNSININRILSTVKSSKVKGSLLGIVNSDNQIINDIKTIEVKDKDLCDSESNCVYTNTFQYDIDSNFNEFLSSDNYSSWSDFSTNWKKESYNDLDRLPFLNSFNNTYSNISDINIVQDLTKTYNINDYISPNNLLTRNIVSSVSDESSIKINSSGDIDILSSGTTNVKVINLYDGLVKNINVTVEYTPHYTVNIKPNGSSDDDIVVNNDIGTAFIVPECTFNYPDYEFVSWNTYEDGTGLSFSPGDVFEDFEDKDILTLYAQWKLADLPNDITSASYVIDHDDLTIDFIEYNASLDSYLNKITNTGFNMEVDTKNINGTEKLYTGSKTKLYYKTKLIKEYINIVRGDVNGNGKIDIIDYIRIRKDIMNTEKLTGIYFNAGDMNNNSKIDIIDYIRIRKIIMEG